MTLANIHPYRSVSLAQYQALRNALADALEGLQELRPYVGDYFAAKLDLDEYEADAQDALTEADETVRLAVAL